LKELNRTNRGDKFANFHVLRTELRFSLDVPAEVVVCVKDYNNIHLTILNDL